MSTKEPSARLDEFDEIEWRDIARVLWPGLTDDEFAAAWALFHEIKDRKKLQ